MRCWLSSRKTQARSRRLASRLLAHRRWRRRQSSGNLTPRCPRRSAPSDAGASPKARPSFARTETICRRRRKNERLLKQKLFQALHDLVGAGDIDKRLTHAGNYLVHLQEPDIPKEYRAEVAAIKEIMFTTPLSSEQGYVPRQISDEDGEKLARRILSLFTDVMGGL